jgi:hypothetical protein
MAFRDFMKERGQAQVSVAETSQRQNAATPDPERSIALCGEIIPQWRSGWNSIGSGRHETRRHVGESTRGFHPGVETVRRVATGQFSWGAAYETPEKALAAATELERIQREAIEECED